MLRVQRFGNTITSGDAVRDTNKSIKINIPITKSIPCNIYIAVFLYVCTTVKANLAIKPIKSDLNQNNANNNA